MHSSLWLFLTGRPFVQFSGAMFIATTPGSNWVQHCSMSSAALSTTPCRGLGIQNSEFKENIARGGGGALFMTDSSTVHFDTKVLSPQYCAPLREDSEKRFCQVEIAEMVSNSTLKCKPFYASNAFSTFAPNFLTLVSMMPILMPCACSGCGWTPT